MSAANFPRKRRRTNTFIMPVARAGKRPIDKVLPNILMNDLVGAQQSQTLVTANTACTVTGIRWNLSAAAEDALNSNTTRGGWAIVILRDGNAANTLSFTGGSNFYEPEQDVLAFGRWQLQGKGVAGGSSPTVAFYDGKTETMRKLKIGDSIVFIALGTALNNVDVIGTVQLLCKF